MEKKLQKIYLTYYNLLIVQRSMASSLSNLVNNLSDGTHKIKSKYGYDNEKCEISRIRYKYCDCFLQYTNFEGDLIEYKCL